MTNKFLISLLCTVLLSALRVWAGEAEPPAKQTFIYAVKGADTLRLDYYDTQAIAASKPCFIFVFGGGFANGRRDDAGFLPFYARLVNAGYTVAAIDYRLGMKNLKAQLNPEQDQLQAFNQITDIFDRSVTMAVEDLFDATAYIAAHAAAWRIDAAKIIACGSSAGAITVLQGAYKLCHVDTLTARLPEGFKYAGVVSFAGAIFSRNGRLEWPTLPPPLLLFHGDTDRDVPYHQIEWSGLGFYGSAFIAGQLKAQKAPHYFYAVENTGHEMSTLPMNQNWDEMHTFLEKMVFGKEKLIIHTSVTPTDKPEGKKELTLLDFIGNFI
ncbi:MAG: alpha/beta hydrolase [Prevotellaceae bacterium]|jgi:acetyl esterase/lipase|nr:alpha/beta hydrolase [Prevotellaceae bacterium]